MISRISNEFLSADIKYFGAELCSLVNFKNKKQMIWQGNAEFWPRHAPLLFPIVGGLKNDMFYHKNKQYAMNRHGFARDYEFLELSNGGNNTVFQLTSDNTQKEEYPFQYVLTISYSLNENVLKQQFTVKNIGTEKMYFSVGAHPAFNIHYNKNPRLVFYQQKDYTYKLLKDNLIDNKTYILPSELDLNKDTFINDAFILDHEIPQSIELWQEGEKVLEVKTKDFKHLGLWNKPKAEFVCIEPWCGFADTLDASGDIQKKEGIEFLEPNKEKLYGFEIVVY